ncbi:MAG: HlyD family efflux transporter periplasmic adaptor subunit [Oscillatoriaceae bacterium SKW80]|nr:HlyD family efflux transporter periplasmic adaptor subunit [Oscillatoriaceae bacterium SKYG93]MCX8122006.1 HlyD family efflux transporter periplasmic adaptor subunit [Oscillatoriaceae bacterium SKW80]MDW8454292.1 HlyD family efflux transporter periplasmic adaptor subunit [Oscillatoriaceae cyanobacterium SKYGB_i_bin93]HIK29156.1 HlyD family efflux transporter periplasmic adaptor subunit [Oscillatoriaceae cyanobacterium M7585_C2015_266]
MKSAQVFDKPRQSESASDQPVILEQPAVWAQVLVWLIIGITISGLIWSVVAQIEQAVPAMGKLEPEDAPKDVRAPVGGVVREVLVKEGERVKQGDILLTFDPTASEAEVESLKKLQEELLRENNFYSAAISGGNPSGVGSELESLTRERNSLLAENEVFQALIDEFDLKVAAESRNFNAIQQTLWLAHRREYLAIEETERSQIQNLEEKLSQTRALLAAARIQKATAEQKLSKAQQQVAVAREQLPRALEQVETAQKQLATLQQQKSKNEEVLALNQQILNQVSPLVEEGALSLLQKQRQQQEVLIRQAEVISGDSQILNSKNDIEARKRDVLNAQNQIEAAEREVLNIKDEINIRQSEINRLNSEVNQVEGQIEIVKKEAASKKISWLRDKRDKIQSNKQRIAQIDSEIGRKKQENQKQIAQINGQLTKAQQLLQYQELRAPVAGYIFDLKASPGFVVREVDPNPILKIVPEDKIIASVYINNKDIALVKEGMKADVNIEAFPSMEFGTIEGTLKSIGSDALAPTQERPFYAFPAKIELERQYFEINGKKIPIQSGMAVQASIKIGKRTVMDMLLDRMNRKVKTLETVK